MTKTALLAGVTAVALLGPAAHARPAVLTDPPDTRGPLDISRVELRGTKEARFKVATGAGGRHDASRTAAISSSISTPSARPASTTSPCCAPRAGAWRARCGGPVEATTRADSGASRRATPAHARRPWSSPCAP
ncbi:MAG: hypothetical protein H0W21_06445 [Actinobacteria bacterium]|nr:hypothetical protein [Actinomycetota bacterium]